MTDPDDGDDLDQNAQLDRADTLDDNLVADPLDEGYSPPDRQPAGEGWGTTAREEREGEPIEQRLAEEEPDVDYGSDDGPDDGRDVDDETGEKLGDCADSDGELIDDEVGDRRGGRLTAVGGEFDDDEELFAQDVGIDGAGASAEEAAVHVVRDER